MVQTPEGLLVFGGRGSSSELCIIREPGTASCAGARVCGAFDAT